MFETGDIFWIPPYHDPWLVLSLKLNTRQTKYTEFSVLALNLLTQERQVFGFDEEIMLKWNSSGIIRAKEQKT